jgi:hypothetical protein
MEFDVKIPRLKWSVAKVAFGVYLLDFARFAHNGLTIAHAPVLTQVVVHVAAGAVFILLGLQEFEAWVKNLDRW